MRFSANLAAAFAVAYAATGAAGAAVSAGPVSTAPPTVVGVAAAGQQLLGAPGYWSAAGTLHYKYQWYRCDSKGARCASINGATSLTVTLVDADVGNTLGLTVSATDS